MPLPEDPKERMKILLIVGMVAVMALYGAVQGVLKLKAKRGELAEELLDLEWKVSSSRRDVISAEGYRPKNVETLQSIIGTSDEHLLHPILGNYRLGVSRIVERHCVALKMDTPTVQEVGIVDLPKPKNKKLRNVFKGYVVRIVMDWRYTDTIRLIEALEADNPYLSVVGIAVDGVEKAPEKHRTVLSVQWPIWDSDEAETVYRDRLEAELNRG